MWHAKTFTTALRLVCRQAYNEVIPLVRAMFLDPSYNWIGDLPLIQNFYSLPTLDIRFRIPDLWALFRLESREVSGLIQITHVEQGAGFIRWITSRDGVQDGVRDACLASLTQGHLEDFMTIHGSDACAEIAFPHKLSKYLCSRLQRRLDKKKSPHLIPIDVRWQKTVWRRGPEASEHV